MKIIESKIAKNGVKMYFAVDENGKKRRIKANAYVVMECAMQYTAQREHDDAMSEVNTSADAIDAAVEAEIEIINNNSESSANVDVDSPELAEIKADVFETFLAQQNNMTVDEYRQKKDRQAQENAKLEAKSAITCKVTTLESYAKYYTAQADYYRGDMINIAAEAEHDASMQEVYVDWNTRVNHLQALADKCQQEADTIKSALANDPILVVEEKDACETGYDEKVFDLIPTVDELNDVEIVSKDANHPVGGESVKDKIEYVAVNDEEIQLKNGKFFGIWNYAYDAGFYADEANYAVKIHCTDGSRHTVLIDDEAEFFDIMTDRGACTIDNKPTRPLVETYYFNGGWWESVTLEQEVVNSETLLFDKDELLIIYGDRYGAKIMFLPNGDIAYFVKYLDENHRYSADYDRVDEGDFWLEMADRGACTLEPATNDLVAHTYELPDTYDEFGEGIRKFKVGDSYNGDVITFYRNRWVVIDSPRLSGAKITRSAVDNNDTIHYHIYQHMYKDGKYCWVEPDAMDIPAEEFWFTMYRRGHMRRTKPFEITIESFFKEPDRTYEFMDIKLDYDDDGDGGYYIYNVKTINGKVHELELANVRRNEVSPFIKKIKDAFVTVDAIKIFKDGTIKVINDEVAAVAEACAAINAHAPEGWEIRFDSGGKFFPVEFKGKIVAKLDSLATQKFLSPERFFEQFRPLADPNYTAKQQFIADRYNELAMLEEMREEIADDVEQLKTLEEMIEQVKRDIAAEEIAG